MVPNGLSEREDSLIMIKKYYIVPFGFFANSIFSKKRVYED